MAGSADAGGRRAAGDELGKRHIKRRHQHFCLMPPFKLSRPWDCTSLFFLFSFLDFFASSFSGIYRFLMTFETVPYMKNSYLILISAFHDVECHVIFSGRMKNRMQLRFRWSVPPLSDSVRVNRYVSGGPYLPF